MAKWIKGKREYIDIAEKTLGKSLPKKAVIHHHTDGSLVICENQSYHMLLHQRMRAMKGCGNPNKRKCHFCKEWDEVVNLKETGKSGFYHSECSRKHAMSYYYANKTKIRAGRLEYEKNYRAKKKAESHANQDR